jgi:hypothetical protein
MEGERNVAKIEEKNSCLGKEKGSTGEEHEPFHEIVITSPTRKKTHGHGYTNTFALKPRQPTIYHL